MLGGAVRRRLSLRAVVLLEAYSGLLAVLFLIEPNVYVLLGGAAAAGVRAPDHRLVRDRAPPRGDAGPSARPSGGGAHDDRAHGSAARLARRRRAAQRDLGAVAVAVLLVTLGEAMYATAATALRSPPPLEEPA